MHDSELSLRPRFALTPGIARDLMAIEAARAIVDVLPLPAYLELQLKQRARIRSAHHSTAIEGNPLDLDAARRVVEASEATPPATIDERAAQEVRNYFEVMKLVERLAAMRAEITEAVIRRLHATIIVQASGRRKRLSEYRDGQNVVTDRSTGQITYMPPEARDVPGLMRALVEWIHAPAPTDLPVPVVAAVATYWLVTIHPFWDGNGRTARALANLILYRAGYGLHGFVSFEEYYHRDLARYYDRLQMGLNHNYYFGRNDPDLTPWLEYFVQGMADECQRVRAEIERLYLQVGAQEHPLFRNLDREQRVALSIFRTHSELTTALLVEHLRINPRTARDWIETWLETGFLEVLRPGRKNRAYVLGAVYRPLLKGPAVGSATPFEME